MIYAFKNLKTGEVEGFDYPMGEAPLIGSVIRRGKQRYQRVVQLSEIYVDHNGEEPYVSSSLPLNYEPHKQAGGKFAKKGDKVGGRLCRGGEPVFESKRQQQLTQNRARDFSEHDQIRNPKLEPFRSRT